MKKTTKAFLILGIVIGFTLMTTMVALFMLGSSEYPMLQSYYGGFLSILFYGFVNVIVDTMAIGKLEKVKKRDKKLVALGVITIILGSVIAGILILSMNNDDLKEEIKKDKTA